ncbi:MAG TPA: ABC transporter permease [Verrucomicrobiales bacterium]|nr:ABC transporter permease [Verrucomicrobiales bacterium]
MRAVFLALREIWGHKVRSLLTLFCVLLGVASVVMTVGYMRGLTSSWKVWINSRGGAEKFTISPGFPPREQRHLRFRSPGRTMADVRAIRTHCPHVTHVAPSVRLNDSPVRAGNKTYYGDVEGVTPDIAPVERFEVEKGRFLADLDVERANQVVVLGSEAGERLFGPAQDPVGKTVLIGGLAFEVVGLMPHFEISAGGSFNAAGWKNEKIFMPITVAQRKIRGNDLVDELDVRVKDLRYMDMTVAQVENVLLQVHRGIQDFRVRTMTDRLEDINTQERNLMTAGYAVSLLTLLIGGIGIMNLMLASIHERVREIGIRKAVGANGFQIFIQFCIESVTLCTLGGLFGVALGCGLIHVLQRVIEEGARPELTTLGVAAGFAASVTIGSLAGLYPAARAAKLDPVEALGYE